MGRSAEWIAAATGRPAMRSPGRPPVARREHRQRFWQEIAAGSTSEQAGVAAGVSPAVGRRWFRECGGMPPSDFEPDAGRDLSFAEREEIALCRADGHGVREIAQRLSRSPSTISRELRRNAAATRAAAQAGLTARRRANALRNAGFSTSISILALIIRTPILGLRPGRHHSLTWPIPHRRPRAVGCCRHPSVRAE
jgi:hypothetical protein